MRQQDIKQMVRQVKEEGEGVKGVQKVLMSEAEIQDSMQSRCVCACVCVYVCVSQGHTVVRQLIPTGNSTAVLLGQCAIISFIIITACSSSCALPLHPAHGFLQLFSSS